MPHRFELDPFQLRAKVDAKQFSFKTTEDIDPLSDVIGQRRAVRAIQFGLNMKSQGYNIFVPGMPGTGKSTIVRDLAKRHARQLPVPDDLCMVNNFSDEYRPKTVAVAPGTASRFGKMMARLISDLKKELPEAMRGEEFQEKQASIKKKYTELRNEVLARMEQEAAKRNVRIGKTAEGMRALPLVDGEPISAEDFEKLSPERRAELEQLLASMEDLMENSMVEANRIWRQYYEKLEELNREAAMGVVREHLELFRDEFRGRKAILSFLDELQADILENVAMFLPKEKGELPDENFFLRYRVNILVDNAKTQGAPVIFEPSPTFYNVFGTIEKRVVMGAVMTDFSMVREGSILRANGGFLIMEIDSVLMNSHVWECLKRALQNKKLFIEDVPSESVNVAASLRPEPIPIDVKVILLGDHELFRMLQNHDARFNKIFKVRADFDFEVEKNDETVRQYAQFIARACAEEKLLPFSAPAIAAIIEYCEKFVSHQERLTLRFGPVVGILKETDYWARRQEATVADEVHVIKALEEHRFRYNLYEEKLHQSYQENTILVDTDGEVVGQVNGLAVYQVGEYAFGRPSRITAETYLGKKGVINIERESDLSGNTHDKGVMILSGYLGRTFAQNYPLSLSISITFEQSYGPIDGDSASSAELYSIISSLSNVPIRQGIAVTGSVNQKGRIQAIGGVNEKIEGFFEVCKEKGLTGNQGVMIPAANVKNLMLKKEVMEAVTEKQFHIYQVSSAEQGIEILTGLSAGAADMEGNFPKGTVYEKASQKLKKYFVRMMAARKGLGLG